MPDSAVVARGRAKAAERGTTSRRRAVRQPLAKKEDKTTSTATSTPDGKEPPLFADVNEVRNFAGELTDAYLECREQGHPWKFHNVTLNEGAYERTFKCPRCKTEKLQVLTLSGSIYSTSYDHAEGYLHKGGGRIMGEGRDALRLESITRALTKKTGKAA